MVRDEVDGDQSPNFPFDKIQVKDFKGVLERPSTSDHKVNHLVHKRGINHTKTTAEMKVD